jgi:hypothetical protein
MKQIGADERPIYVEKAGRHRPWLAPD